MRLPDAQTAANNAVNFALPWEVDVVKWDKPTHLYGYRIESVRLSQHTDEKVIATFDCSDQFGLLLCAAYERLVLAYYGDENTVDHEAMVCRLIFEYMQGLANAADPLRDQQLVMTGNAVDGVSLTGPFPHSEDAISWAQEHAKDECWTLAPLKHPEA